MTRVLIEEMYIVECTTANTGRLLPVVSIDHALLGVYDCFICIAWRLGSGA